MKAVVLVGGQGTRLRPLTLTTPKQLLPVAEVPLLERVLGLLAEHGVDEVVLSLGYRPDAFTAAYPAGRAAGVALLYAEEPEPLDTAGAIRFATSRYPIDDTFLVVNGDVLTDLDVGALVRFHRDRRALATIALAPVPDPSRYGVVPCDPDGRVLAFVEKPTPGSAPTNLINAGTYVFEPEVLEHIPDGRPVSVEREVFPALVAQGRLFALASDAYWLDTGTPAALLQAQRDLLDGTRRPPPAPGAVELAPGVWVLGSPKLEGAVLAPSLVGDAAVVEAGATVEGTVVGHGAYIGAGAEVRGSLVLAGARIGNGARLERAVVGYDAVVGEDAVLEDLTVLGDAVSVSAKRHLVAARVPEG